MNQDIENIYKIVLEMPQRMLPIEDNSYEKIKNDIDYLRKNSNLLSNNYVIEIRHTLNESKDTVLFFIKNEILIAGYSFKKLSGYIKTTSSWSNPDYKNSFYTAFVQFILPTFKTVESDNSLTDMGYNFWVKLMKNNPNLFFYIKNGSRLFQIENSDEFREYFGDEDSYQEYKFVV